MTPVPPAVCKAGTDNAPEKTATSGERAVVHKYYELRMSFGVVPWLRCGGMCASHGVRTSVYWRDVTCKNCLRLR